MIELLSPAGSLKTLKAVINAGADAVYCGGEMYSARAYAGNLTNEELLEALDYAHLRDKQVHLTVNTLTKDDELSNLFDFILPLYERGLDAVIVQDIGVFSFLRDNFPDLPLHASTQMSVASKFGAEFLALNGAKRVVLARELSIRDIESIHRFNPNLELECFIHGALCVSYSGQCLFSSFLGGRSGNRGRCAGTCRLPYEYNGKTEYPLSLKDLCAIDYIPEMVKAGVSSFKIEGRMKQTEYAAGVTAVYREYIDKYFDLGDSYRVTEKDFDKLLKLGNRSGFTTGYLADKKGADMISISSPSHVNEELLSLNESFDKIPVNLNASFFENKPLSLSLSCKGKEVCVYGDIPDIAMNAPLSKSDVTKTLTQTGDTEFVVNDLNISLDGNLFVPKGKLKSIRREAFDVLKNTILKPYFRDNKSNATVALKSFEKKECNAIPSIFVTCDSISQLYTTLEYDEVKRIGIRIHSEDFSQVNSLKEAISLINSHGKEAVIILPNVLRERSLKHYKELLEKDYDALYLATSYDSLGLLDHLSIKENRIILDSSVYIFNAYALSFFNDKEYKEYTYSLELSAKDLSCFSGCNASLIIYGRTPFMVTEQCIKKNHHNCDKKDSVSVLTDRYKKDLIIKNYCNTCTSILYNPIPMSVIGSKKELERIDALYYRIDFTDEDSKQVSSIMNSAIAGKSLEFETTKGHFKQSVC